MACPTCDHTMQAIVAGDMAAFWWCPRCGTVRSFRSGGRVADSVPRLVEHVRSIERDEWASVAHGTELDTSAILSITESAGVGLIGEQRDV